jgi:PKD repeat protein
LKTKRQNINVRELFRKKLENAEVIPDAAVKSILMHRVARKEFMRFNPARLNIYYIGGIVITGITVAVMLFSGSHSSYHLNPLDTPGNLNKTDTGKYIEVPVEQPVRIKPGKSTIIHSESNRSIDATRPSEKSRSEASKEVESHKDSTSFPTGISNSLSKNSLFAEATSDKKRLQSGFKPEAFLIDPHDTVGCAPLKVRFHYKSTSCDSCRWTFGDGGYSKKKDPEWIFDIDGEYRVVLEIYCHDGKFLSSSVTVTVHPRPQAHFEIASSKSVNPNDEIRFLNYSTNAVHFKWDFGDGYTSEEFEPSHIYAKYGNWNVRLEVLSDWGCSDSAIFHNALSGLMYFISFPNAFIPNTQGPSGGYYSSKSDEAALVFHPSSSGVSEYQLKIFSKLGIQIFESNDINLGWDGYNNGQLCEPGVYIWKVRGKFRNGEPILKMGDVTLLKN